MATNENWAKVVKEISPILSKTESHKKKANKKQLKFLIIAGGIAMVGALFFWYLIYKFISGLF